MNVLGNVAHFHPTAKADGPSRSQLRKKRHSFYFDWISSSQIPNVEDSLEIKEVFITHRLDKYISNMPPINNIKCEITMEEYFERWNMIEKKNKQFEEFDKKQLKFEFWEKE